MTKIGSKLFVICFLFLSVLINSTFVWASSESLKIEIQPEQVGVGDQLYLYITVQSTDDFSMDEPQLPQIKGLQLLQAQNNGQSSSTRMNFINGKTEFSKTVQQQYVAVYQATQSGIVTIPAISVNVNGKMLTSVPQKISISSESNAQRRGAGPSGRPQFEDDPFADEDDMFNQLMRQRQKMMEEMQKQLGGQGLNPRNFGLPNGGGTTGQIPSRKLDVNTNEAFFILLETDKKTVFEGEQITASWYLYTRGNIESLDRAKFPDLKGFWKEIIEEIPSLYFQDEIVNGIPFRKALLASHALFPIKPGTAVIDEFKIKAKVRLPTQFGWGNLNEYTKASRRYPVTVLPLPADNKPLSFSGAVGQFQIQTTLEGTEFSAGQPFSLKVRFEGQGNAKLIELPNIDWPAGVEIYDTKSEAKFFKDGQSYKEFEVLLLAHNPGEVKIPPIMFSYFDPVLKQYITKSTEEFVIKISEAVKGSQSASVEATNKNKKALEKSVEQSLLPVTEIEASVFDWSKYRYIVLSALSLLAVMVMLGQFFWRMFKIDNGSNLQDQVNHKIKLIEQGATHANYKLLGAESINLLYLVGAHLAQEKGGTDDWASIIYKMSEAHKQKYEERLTELFNYFQIVGFAPDVVRDATLQQQPVSSKIAELKSISAQISSEVV